MRIKKSSLLYRLYALSYRSYCIDIPDRTPPERVGVCSYLPRAVVGVVFSLPMLISHTILAYVVKGVVFVVWYGYFWPFSATTALLTGRLPTAKDPADFGRYRPFRIGGWQFYPAHLLAPAVVGGLSFAYTIGWIGNSVPLFGAFLIEIVVLVFACLLSMAADRELGIWKGFHPPDGSPAPQPSLLAAWIRAKRDRFCPTIEFVDGA